MDFIPKKNCIFRPKICIFYAYEIPIFSAQTDLTQLDHNPEVTLDTFGISSRWLFGRPFWDTNCPKWPFLGPKTLFLARNQFFAPARSFFGSKNWPKNQIFFTLHLYNPAFSLFDHDNCIISYGIAWYWIVGCGAQDTYVLYYIQHEIKR